MENKPKFLDVHTDNNIEIGVNNAWYFEKDEEDFLAEDTKVYVDILVEQIVKVTYDSENGFLSTVYATIIED